MIKHYPLFIFLLLLSGPTLIAQKPVVYEHQSVFYNSAYEPYVEVYISVEASTLTWHYESGKWQSGSLVNIFIEDGDQLKNFDQFKLLSAPAVDTLNRQFTIETVRRIAIDPGNYSLSVKVSDLFNDQHQNEIQNKALKVSKNNQEAFMSDLILLDHYQASKKDNELVRNGFLMKPDLFSYYPDGRDTLLFYAEVYLPGKTYLGQDLALFYSIHQHGNKNPAGTFQLAEKRKGQAVIPILASMDIHGLPSGNYDLVLEVRSRDNTLLATNKAFFQRSSRYEVADLQNLYLTDIDQTFVEAMTDKDIADYLPTMKIIASAVEQRAIADLLTIDQPEMKKKFFYNFWLIRNLENPEKAWSRHKQAVDYADRLYETSNRAGYLTDRGRVYIQYGPPTEITASPSEANAAPYEIWQYNRIPNNETNVIFVFSEKDLSNNDYFLIHSDATGEIHNERWKMDLYQNFEMYNSNDLDKTNPDPNFGTKPSGQYPR